MVRSPRYWQRKCGPLSTKAKPSSASLSWLTRKTLLGDDTGCAQAVLVPLLACDGQLMPASALQGLARV